MRLRLVSARGLACAEADTDAELYCMLYLQPPAAAPVQSSPGTLYVDACELQVVSCPLSVISCRLSHFSSSLSLVAWS